jgi:MinD superfamily P-loop ATPase
MTPAAPPEAVLEAWRRVPRRVSPARRSGRRAAPAVPDQVAAASHPAAAEAQVIALWSGRGAPGKTTLGLNCLALGGAVEPTVLVELDTTAASLAAYLDDGQAGAPRRAQATLLELAHASRRTAAEWTQALEQVLQPLGPYSPQARLLCGIAHPEQRGRLTEPTRFVEELVTHLRARFARIWLDVGSDPLSGDSVAAQVGTTALRLADQVLVVATPEPACVHRACMAIREAGSRLDRDEVRLVVNRAARGDSGSWISNAVGLPLAAVLPADERAQARAILAAHPVVREADSRLRRPLQEFLADLGSPANVATFAPAPPAPRGMPFWGALRARAGGLAASLGSAR